MTPVAANLVTRIAFDWIAELTGEGGVASSAAGARATVFAGSSRFTGGSAVADDPLPAATAAAAGRVPRIGSSVHPTVVAAIPAMLTRTARLDVVGSASREPTSGITR